ncbi:2-isopropylmalate synthase [Motilibacter peucedani]|uniref:Citramalate synthase n=1 Tax=Motilibacter peucedani TaxID=598650 RepID=A0A420XUV1_9ACTN|nr:citramalate synthase [Motilibacter peucedani]RKS80614.1 2-isopropylmalate synthase [Motilibacter peucedani]
MSPASSEFHVYDTTLRDGAQQEGLTLTVADKLAIARHLDDLGVGYIEGGWPGASPKDTEFFRLAQTELELRHATLAAFGSTRRVGKRAADDELVAALRDSMAPVVTLVAKSHALQVEKALRTTPEEGLAMLRDTVTHLREEGRRVFVDAEHFFDGYRYDPRYALEFVRVAAESGAEVVALCDTNGGLLPDELADTVAAVLEASSAKLGIHCHNDAGCAVANTLAAVAAGATHVQGTLNGYGERTGNADLVTIVANLELKKRMSLLEGTGLAEATRVAHAVSEITNIPPYARQPYVGSSAFTHKAGLHASAIKVDPDLYQHADPSLVGNDMRLLVSEMAGRASVELKGKELGYDLSGERMVVTRLTDRVKEMESRGYTFEAADASFELLLLEEVEGVRRSWFDIESWHVSVDSRSHEATVAEATVKVHAAGKRNVAIGEGNGPVNALDAGLRQALAAAYPVIETFELVDYKVRVVDVGNGTGTGALTRVLLTTANQSGEAWTTVGVGVNVIGASWEALVDGYSFGLLRAGVQPALLP